MPAVPWEKFGMSLGKPGSMAHFRPPFSGRPSSTSRVPALAARSSQARSPVSW